MFPTTERAHGSFGQLLKLGFDTILCLNWLFIGKSFKVLSPSRAWQLNPTELFFFSAGLAISFAPFYHHHFCNMIGRHNLYIASAKFSLWHENRLQIDKTQRVASLRIVQTETSSARWRFNPSTLKSVYLATIFGPRKLCWFLNNNDTTCQGFQLSMSRLDDSRLCGSSFPLFAQHGWASNVSIWNIGDINADIAFNLSISCRKDNNFVFLNYYKRFYLRNLVVGLPSSQLWLAGICNCKLCRYSNHFFLD